MPLALSNSGQGMAQGDKPGRISRLKKASRVGLLSRNSKNIRNLEDRSFAGILALYFRAAGLHKLKSLKPFLNKNTKASSSGKKAGQAKGPRSKKLTAPSRRASLSGSSGRKEKGSPSEAFSRLVPAQYEFPIRKAMLKGKSLGALGLKAMTDEPNEAGGPGRLSGTMPARDPDSGQEARGPGAKFFPGGFNQQPGRETALPGEISGPGLKRDSSPKTVLIDLRPKADSPGGESRPLNLAYSEAGLQEEKELPITFKPFTMEAQRDNPAPALSRQIFKAFGERVIPELVQKTAIIVKEGGDGEIRLVLKPESLGNVRIRVNIANNTVEVRIVVENNNVKALFEGSLDHLKSSLREEGFQAAGLEVSVGNRKTRDQAGGDELPFRRGAEVGSEFERTLPGIFEFYHEHLMVNLII